MPLLLYYSLYTAHAATRFGRFSGRNDVVFQMLTELSRPAVTR